jgi:ketosteroid isomerase-like protein
MSQENLEVARKVELLRRWFEAFNARDIERIIALSDPRIEAHSRWAAVGEVTVYRGHGGLRSWEIEETWDDLHAEVEALFDLGERALTFYTLHGRGRQSGAPSSMWFAMVARWHAGRCVHWKAYVDRGEALRELGVSEDELEAAAT